MDTTLAKTKVDNKVNDLKSKIVLKSLRNVKLGYKEEEASRGLYRSDVRLGLERTRLLTESYKATEGEEWVIRRAKALDHILRNMTVYIQNHERIVGNYAAAPNELHFPIELNWKSYLKAVNSEVGRSLLTDEGRTEFKTLCNYWNGKALRDIQLKYFAGVADLEKYFKYDGTFMWNPT